MIASLSSSSTNNNNITTTTGTSFFNSSFNSIEKKEQVYIDPKQVFLNERSASNSFSTFLPSEQLSFFEVKFDDEEQEDSVLSISSEMDTVYSENEENFEAWGIMGTALPSTSTSTSSSSISHQQAQLYQNQQFHQQQQQQYLIQMNYHNQNHNQNQNQTISLSSISIPSPSPSYYSSNASSLVNSPLLTAHSTPATSTSTSPATSVAKKQQQQQTNFYQNIKQENISSVSRDVTPEDEEDEEDDDDFDEDEDSSNPLDKRFKELLPLSTKKFNEKIAEWKLKKEEVDYLKKKRRRVKNAKAARTRRSKISCALKELQEKVSVLEGQLKDKDRIIRELNAKLKSKK